MTVDETAEVVVIGGGAVGASTAFHLTELGITDVVLVERDVLAGGSTSKASGGIRLQFGDETNIRIGLRSMESFESFTEITGVDIDFRQNGYMFLLNSEDQVEKFSRAIALQNRLGVPSKSITVDEACEILPQLRPDGLTGGTFCPRDGQATPESLVQGYTQVAYQSGIRIRQSCVAESIKTEGGRITGVQTTKGFIATDTVVCAAGTWSPEIGAMVGLDLPVTPHRQSLFFSPDDAGLPGKLPLTIDVGTGLHIHREGPGLVFGGHQNELDELAEPAIDRFPFVEELPLQTSWWGYYEMSPDTNGIVGASPGSERFFFGTGFSGHGFQQSPAVGEHLAELVAGKTPTLDLSALALDRFEREDYAHEELFI